MKLTFLVVCISNSLLHFWSHHFHSTLLIGRLEAKHVCTFLHTNTFTNAHQTETHTHKVAFIAVHRHVLLDWCHWWIKLRVRIPFWSVFITGTKITVLIRKKPFQLNQCLNKAKGCSNYFQTLPLLRTLDSDILSLWVIFLDIFPSILNNMAFPTDTVTRLNNDINKRNEFWFRF